MNIYVFIILSESPPLSQQNETGHTCSIWQEDVYCIFVVRTCKVVSRFSYINIEVCVSNFYHSIQNICIKCVGFAYFLRQSSDMKSYCCYCCYYCYNCCCYCCYSVVVIIWCCCYCCCCYYCCCYYLMLLLLLLLLLLWFRVWVC